MWLAIFCVKSIRNTNKKYVIRFFRDISHVYKYDDVIPCELREDIIWKT